MKAESIVYNPASEPNRAGRWESSGLVQLTFNGMLPAELKPGDHFLAKAEVSRIHTFSTPGAFNYKKHLEYRSIFIKGWIASPADIIKVNTRPQPFISAVIPSNLLQIIRSRIAVFINETLSQPARGLYKAILIGDRRDITPAVLENFIASGCIHILAVSGMHMGLLAFVSITVLTWLLKRSTRLMLQFNVFKFAVTLSLIPLTFYAFIAGLNLPVLRALLMTSVFILAIMLNRPGNIINHILFAALLILAWKPTAIFSASFQLSFSAVAAIALVCPLLFIVQDKESSPFRDSLRLVFFNNKIARINQWLLAGITVTAAAMIGTFPLLLFHFNRISMVSPITNLFVEPLICFWSLIIGLTACFFIPFSPVTAKYLFKAGSMGLIQAEKICAYSASLPYASFRFPAPSIAQIIMYYIFILGIILSFHLKHGSRRICVVSSFLALCCLLTLTVFSNINSLTSTATTVSILDVGHGAATLVQFPGNKTILIDGGGAGNENFNIGERVIAPFLWKKRLRHLDGVIITHPHADHYNGLPFILKHFHPEKLWINGMAGHEPQYRQLLDLAKRLNIKMRIPVENEALLRSGNSYLTCIAGGATVNDASGKTFFLGSAAETDINDMSLVLRLDTPDASFLFPADISSIKANTLRAEGKDLQADVLLAPHHGSRTSMSRDFIAAVAPKYIAISVGRNNTFNLQDNSLQVLKRQRINVYRTYNDGTLTFTVRDGKLNLQRYQIN